MSINIHTVTMKNFLSVGQVTQSVNLNNENLTLILGENLDLGGEGEGARNGVGKTTFLQAISYALFGQAINSIKKDNLINRTNEKGMVVTIDFSVDGVDYKIIRGRKPNILKFFVNNVEQHIDDDAQGDSRETQDAIERTIRMSADMFQHIIGLNSYTTPFLALKAADQRAIIEQLLGITLLSEKADAIKELNKTVKDDITREEFRVKGVEEANKRISEQIESLKRRQGLWKKKYDSDLAYLVTQYDELTQVDITAELLAHKDLAIYNEQKKQIEQFQSILQLQSLWQEKNKQETTKLLNRLIELNKVDITAELQAHKDLEAYNELSKKITETRTWIARCEADEKREQKVIDKLKVEVAELEDHKCYACGQEFHDDKHNEVLSAKKAALQEAALQALSTNTQYLEHTDTLAKLGELGDKPVTYYKTVTEAIKHSSEIERVEQQLQEKNDEVDPYKDQLAVEPPKLGRKPTTIYKTEAEAIKHSNTVANLEQQIAAKAEEADPYSEQIADMETNAIQELSYDEINRLNRVLQHQEYLLDLLTNKKSFVRKRIIEQNLAYLNNRLTHYLERMGLPHQVVFQNDLTVDITELGRELDFDNLSRGERNRLILGLSFAFRDVWESLFSPVNAMFVDELIDNGLDTIGVENALGLLKEMTRKRNKSIWLVSHRDELVSRVSSVLKVVKESGFTSYSSETETV